MSWCFVPVRKYAVFSGRARRREFWWFALVATLLGAVLEGAAQLSGSTALSWVASGYFAALVLPALAVSVRRLHDQGKSAWWLPVGVFCPCLPLYLILMMFNGELGANRYGPDPKPAPGPAPAPLPSA